ncbi:MAG: cation:proton antiporter [Opitutaceae bacterium]
MDGVNFIQDLAVVLLTAGIAAAICRKVHLSVIVGYLVAGMIVGPYTPPVALITDAASIQTLSQVGLVFLMFGIGLGLSLSKMREMGVQVLLATALGAFFVLNLTLLLGRAADWSPLQSVFVAAMLMTSSSAVIAKVMQEINMSHSRAGQLALSVTVLEDIVAVVMLAVLGAQTGLAASTGVGALLTGLTAFVVLLVMLGLFFVPRLLRRFDGTGDPELQTILVAGAMFLMALLAAKAGYSLALGAFMLGLIVAETPQYRTVERSFSGARDMFSSVFFVSIGMMIDVRLLFDAWPWVLGLTAFAMIARPIATSIAMTIVGTPRKDARRAALALVPLGEFSFLVAQLGVESKILPATFYPMAVGASVLTVFLMPIVNRHGGAIVGAVDRIEPAWLKKALATYSTWLAQLGKQDTGRLWWKLSRKRFGQIALEMIFVTGLLIFSDRILPTLERSEFVTGIEPTTFRIVFWSVIGIASLIPLVAIWRNISALAMIFGETARANSRVPSAVASTGIKAAGALLLAYWLLQIIPLYTFSRWAWLGIGAALILALAVFYRRLIYWHSEWQYSLESALGASKKTAPAAPQWTQQSSEWKLNVQEHMVPERAVYAGRSIADLAMRSRFGSTIAEINRQGHTIIAPSPNERLYPGDRLLLLGEPEQVARAREELEKTDSAIDPVLPEAVLDTVDFSGGPRVGASLAELQIPLNTGVILVGIERGPQHITNPTGSDRLEAGDRLLVLGTPRRLKRFREWLGV